MSRPCQELPEDPKGWRGKSLEFRPWKSGRGSSDLCGSCDIPGAACGGPSAIFPWSSDEPWGIFWDEGLQSVSAGMGCFGTILGLKSPNFGACGCVSPQSDKYISCEIPTHPGLAFLRFWICPEKKFPVEGKVSFPLFFCLDVAQTMVADQFFRCRLTGDKSNITWNGESPRI